MIYEFDMPPQDIGPQELAQAIVDLGFNAVGTKTGRMYSKTVMFPFLYGRSDTLNSGLSNKDIQELHKEYKENYPNVLHEKQSLRT